MKRKEDIEYQISEIVESTAKKLDKIFPAERPEKDGVNSNFCGYLEEALILLLRGYAIQGTYKTDSLNQLVEDDE